MTHRVKPPLHSPKQNCHLWRMSWPAIHIRNLKTSDSVRMARPRCQIYHARLVLTHVTRFEESPELKSSKCDIKIYTTHFNQEIYKKKYLVYAGHGSRVDALGLRSESDGVILTFLNKEWFTISILKRSKISSATH